MKMHTLWTIRRPSRLRTLMAKHTAIKMSSVFNMGYSLPMRYPFIYGGMSSRVAIAYGNRKPLKYKQEGHGDAFWIWYDGKYTAWLLVRKLLNK